MAKDITRDMLNTIRVLTEERAIIKESDDSISVPNDVKFGNTIKTLVDVVKRQLSSSNLYFEDKPLLFYPDEEDLVMNFIVKDMNNTVVQFVLNDTDGEGCKITTDNLRLTDDSLRRIQQIKYSYESWKDKILSDSTFLKELKEALKDSGKI